MTAQAWNRKGQPNRAVLEHARALLLALAVLVERAAGLPAARRLWFLAVMAGGEAEARRLIVAMAFDRCPGSPTEAAAPLSATDHRLCTPPTVAGDAAVLAARFRMLALAVGALLAQVAAEPPCRHAARSVGRLCRKPRLTAQFTPSPALRATSPP